MRGRVLVARGAAEEAATTLASAVDAAEEAGYPLVALRRRILLAEARAGAGDPTAAGDELRSVVEEADRREARLIRAEAEAAAGRIEIDLPGPAEPPVEPGPEPEVLPLGERLVTSLFADVRDYSELTAAAAPEEVAERMATLYRFAKAAVERQQGIVDKFAGDAVMATFNVSGARTDHCVQALEAALSLRDKAALMDLPVGIGIAVGAAVLGRGASDANISVTGVATNLAARLQAAAGEGEILLSDEAHRRVEGWLGERGLTASPGDLELKGFEDVQVGYRIPAPVQNDR
jgi:adenylate cyclase